MASSSTTASWFNCSNWNSSWRRQRSKQARFLRTCCSVVSSMKPIGKNYENENNNVSKRKTDLEEL